jgi:nucleoside-diphosphate kinase
MRFSGAARADCARACGSSERGESHVLRSFTCCLAAALPFLLFRLRASTHIRSLPQMIKPDGVQRGLVGEIIKRFEQKGYKLVAMKMLHASREFMEKHYEDLKDKKFFPGLITYMVSGPVVCMVWEGMGVIAGGRRLLGATKPSDSAQGTIRGDFAVDVGRNICHGSDSVAGATAEIANWFPEGLIAYTAVAAPWIYE